MRSRRSERGTVIQTTRTQEEDSLRPPDLLGFGLQLNMGSIFTMSKHPQEISWHPDLTVETGMWPGHLHPYRS